MGQGAPGADGRSPPGSPTTACPTSTSAPRPACCSWRSSAWLSAWCGASSAMRTSECRCPLGPLPCPQMPQRRRLLPLPRPLAWSCFRSSPEPTLLAWAPRRPCVWFHPGLAGCLIGPDWNLNGDAVNLSDLDAHGLHRVPSQGRRWPIATTVPPLCSLWHPVTCCGSASAPPPANTCQLRDGGASATCCFPWSPVPTQLCHCRQHHLALPWASPTAA